MSSDWSPEWTSGPIPLDQAACNVSVDAFEGPLDLLLHLIQKHELDIFAIPIAFVTAKYLEYLRLMESLNLDVAAEYLLMAATLAHIKSRELLPNAPADDVANADGGLEPEEDPRTALIRRLLEYQKFKHAGTELLTRSLVGRDVFIRGAELRAELLDKAPIANLPLHALLEAFQRVLSRDQEALKHEISEERVSIADRIHQLLDQLKNQRTIVFEQLFERDRSRHEMVVTFLALLEMTRLHMTRLYQAAALSPIHVTLVLEEVDHVLVALDVD
jgi:segregation and condensation protein A